MEPAARVRDAGGNVVNWNTESLGACAHAQMGGVGSSYNPSGPDLAILRNQLSEERRRVRLLAKLPQWPSATIYY
jgi:hypothetical protein